MTSFYTNVSQQRGQLLVRGYKDGKRVNRKVQYKPYLFVPDRTGKGEYRSLIGKKPLARMDFASISDAKEFMDEYDDVAGFEYHGLTRWQYLFINDEYPGLVNFDLGTIRTNFLDIEVDSIGGFPNISKADKEVTAITLHAQGKYYVFACHDFMCDEPDVEFIRCRNERDLLYRFLDVWEESDCDIVTGWNVEGFDIPYLYTRISNVLSKEDADRLSPWRITRKRSYFDKMGREQEAVILEGIATLDYLQLYLKFTYTRQEQYTLDYISKVELDDKKVDYKSLGYESLADLQARNFQLYLEYNVHDVRLVVKLDEKMKFLDQAMAIAYDAKINFEDSVTSVLLWDIIIHNHLMDKKIIVPKQKNGSKAEAIAGAYVKHPQVGVYEWLMSFDLNSLYPHLIMQYNISPETFIRREHGINPDTVLNTAEWERAWGKYAKEKNIAIAGNGAMFRRDERGVLPTLMQMYYDDRKKYKKMMIESQKKLEAEKAGGKDAALMKKYESEIVLYNNLQLAKKVSLNSAYGALSNQWFRFYNDDMAEAITLSGQVSIRWAERAMNGYINKILGTDNRGSMNGQKMAKDFVIASDTDSLYVSMDDIVKRFMSNMTTEQKVAALDKIAEEKFQPFIDSFYQELCDHVNGFEQKMQMKREAIAERGIWSGAKRYIMLVWNNEGVQYKEPKFKMTGIEAVRASTPTACRDMIKKGARIIIDLDQQKLYDFIEQCKKEFNNAPIKDIARNSSVKDTKKYRLGDKGVPSHVMGSLVYNDLVKRNNLEEKYPLIKDGDRVKFVKMKLPNPAQSQWVAFPNAYLPVEFNLDRYIDRDELAQVGFLTPLNTIASAANMNLEPVSSLDAFFC